MFWLGTIGSHLVVPIQILAEVFKLDGFAGRSHAPITLNPEGLNPGQHFAHSSTQQIFGLPAGDALERGIHLEKTIVTGIARFIPDNLVERKPRSH